LTVDMLIYGGAELSGEVLAPPSKSYAQRALLAASLSQGKTVINNLGSSLDVMAMINVCRALGAHIESSDKRAVVHGFERPKAPRKPVNCIESAATMRFVTPIASLSRGRVVIDGVGSLLRRPMQPLIDALRKLGVRCRCLGDGGTPPIEVRGRGRLPGGRCEVPGHVSSQFVSGLLFAAPKAEQNVVIEATTPLESKPYVKMTIEVLRLHRVEVFSDEQMWSFEVPCGQVYRPTIHRVPGDFSSAAFMMAAALVTKSRITVKGLKRGGNQADEVFVDIIREMGAWVREEEEAIEVGYENGLKAISFDASDAPDTVPILASLACFAKGETEISGIGRLSLKESDRPRAIATELSKMGAKILIEGDTMRIRGSKLRGAPLYSYGDHRIAMACAVAALGAEGVSRVIDADVVNKSYPSFFEALDKLGAEVIAW